jgi:hypothetical protein
LVSRVQGTFEFEVQPLREYFAARYLYDTAPYSPAGSAHRGTLPERFESIARNFYWLNVTRFYAGCYSYGELSSLIDGLDDLAESEQLKYVAQPSRLGILLLRDYVFNQYPKLANRVITKIISNAGFRALIGGSWTQRNSHDDLTLPPGTSRNILTAKCFEMIESSSRFDDIYIASKTLTQNCNYEELHNFWNKLNTSNKDRALIIQTGSTLGIFEKITKPEVIELIKKHGDKTLISVLRHQRLDLLEGDDDFFSDIFVRHAVHSGNGFLFFNRNTPNLSAKIISAYGLAIISSGYFLSQMSEDDSSVHAILSSSAAFRGQLLALENYKPHIPSQSTEQTDAFESIINSMGQLYKSKLSEIRTDFSRWDELIELFRSVWGDGSNINAIAINISDLFEGELETNAALKDNTHSLIVRAISARQNINNTDWLSQQFKEYSNNPENIDLLLRSIMKWGESEIFIYFADIISTTMDSVSQETWQAFVNSLNYQNFLEEQKTIDIEPSQIDALPALLSSRFASMLIQLVNDTTKLIIRNRFLSNYEGTDNFIFETEVSSITNFAWSNPDYWPDALKSIRDAYSSGVTYNFDASRIYDEELELPLHIAQEICFNSSHYPVDILSTAEATVLADIGKSIIPVGKIASDNAWFRES